MRGNTDESVTGFTEQTWKTAGILLKPDQCFRDGGNTRVIFGAIDFQFQPLHHYGYHIGCLYN